MSNLFGRLATKLFKEVVLAYKSTAKKWKQRNFSQTSSGLIAKLDQDA